MPLDFLVFNFFISLITYSYFDWTVFSFYDSAIAVNLKACNHFRLYNGKAAEVRIASVCLSVLSICLSVSLSVCLSVCPVYLFVCPTVCLDIILVRSTLTFWLLLFLSQAELKTLQETASPSFSFANDLIKHNLVSNVRHFSLSWEMSLTNKMSWCTHTV